MIYFLVNNNFHLIDAEEHLTQLKNHPTGLITINHKLTISPKHQFDVEMEFPLLINRLMDHFRWFRIFKIHKQVRTQLKDISSTDILIFYTEYEYLTHYVVNLFKEKNAKIILIEEGFPTYLEFSTPPDSHLNFKKKILNFYLKFILGYKTTEIVSINNKPRTKLSDGQIDKILLYNDLNIRRNVPKGLLPTKEIIYEKLNENTVLFLNEGIYDHYVTMEEYLNIIDDILFNLSTHFELVYFKFHPREKESNKQSIHSILRKFPKVEIITDSRPVELMIGEIGAKYVTSFLSQTLLYLSNSNSIPLYIFHMFPELMRNQTFITVKRVIDQMNYTFINDWVDFKNTKIGFSKNKSTNIQKLQFHLDSL